MAGRIISFCSNDNRIPEAAELAEELATIVDRIECDVPTMGAVLFAVAYARLSDCRISTPL